MLNSWPFYRNPLSRGITLTIHLVRHKVVVWPEGIPTLRSWVCSLLFAAVSLLYTAFTTCCWRCCLAVLSHSMSCLAGFLPQFNFCLLELVLLRQQYSGLMPFLSFPVSHPSPLAVGESQQKPTAGGTDVPTNPGENSRKSYEQLGNMDRLAIPTKCCKTTCKGK